MTKEHALSKWNERLAISKAQEKQLEKQAEDKTDSMYLARLAMTMITRERIGTILEFIQDLEKMD
ncbi:MAG: hypothetical protein GWN62_12955 [Aliifodinibius sp.]|nr:hypothetical protein [Fodinibius sp.]